MAVARPLAEPWVARDDRRTGRGRDDELVRGEGELVRRRRRGSGGRAKIRGALARVRRDELPPPRAARRRTARAAAVTPVSSPGASWRRTSPPPTDPRRRSSPRAASSRANAPRYQLAAGRASPARLTRYASSNTKPSATGAHAGIAGGEPLAVDVAPGAQRRQLQRHRARPRAAAATRTPTAERPCAMATSCSSTHVAQVPAPARDAAVEARTSARWTWPAGSTTPPAHSCGRKADPSIPDSHDRVQRCETQMATRCAPGSATDEQPVVAPRAQPGDRAHRVAAEPVGDQPLTCGAPPRGRRRPGGRTRSRHTGRRALRSQPVVGRAISSAISPVQPVWCMAPRPAPLSPWKYSKNSRLSRQFGSCCRRSTQP